MPFDVEPATTMRPPGVIATALALWNRRPNHVSAVPPFPKPGSSVPFGGSAAPRTGRCRGGSFADDHDPAVVLDRDVERVVVGAEVGDHLASCPNVGRASRPV
jgi:hypothetical protein